MQLHLSSLHATCLAACLHHPGSECACQSHRAFVTVYKRLWGWPA